MLTCADLPSGTRGVDNCLLGVTSLPDHATKLLLQVQKSNAFIGASESLRLPWPRGCKCCNLTDVSDGRHFDVGLAGTFLPHVIPRTQSCSHIRAHIITRNHDGMVSASSPSQRRFFSLKKARVTGRRLKVNNEIYGKMLRLSSSSLVCLSACLSRNHVCTNDNDDCLFRD